MGTSLSRLEGTGGGIIDIALIDRDNVTEDNRPITLGDGLLEALPTQDGDALYRFEYRTLFRTIQIVSRT